LEHKTAVRFKERFRLISGSKHAIVMGQPERCRGDLSSSLHRVTNC
jgi:hypothetical protein